MESRTENVEPDTVNKLSSIKEFNITAVEVKVEVDTGEYESSAFGKNQEKNEFSEEPGTEILPHSEKITNPNTGQIINRSLLNENTQSFLKANLNVSASNRDRFDGTFAENENFNVKQSKIKQVNNKSEMKLESKWIEVEKKCNSGVEENLHITNTLQSHSDEKIMDNFEPDELKRKNKGDNNRQNEKRRKKDEVGKTNKVKNNQCYPISNQIMALSHDQQTAMAKGDGNLLSLPENKTETDEIEKSQGHVKEKEGDKADEDNLKTNESTELGRDTDSDTDGKMDPGTKNENSKNEYFKCITCPVCDKKMASHYNLFRHQQSAACLAKRTEQFPQFEFQRKKVKDEEKYVTCPICNKTMVSHGNGNMSRHQLTAACMAKRVEKSEKLAEGETNNKDSLPTAKSQVASSEQINNIEMWFYSRMGITKSYNQAKHEKTKIKIGKDYGFDQDAVTKKEKLKTENKKYVTCPLCNRTLVSHGNLGRHQQTAYCMEKRNKNKK